MSERLADLVVQHADIRGKPYNVLIQLAMAADSKGEVRLTATELRHRTRSTDDASLYSAIRELQQLGYVQKWGQPRTRHAYLVVNERRLNLDALLAKKAAKSKLTAQKQKTAKELRLIRLARKRAIKGMLDGFMAKYRRKLR